MAAKDRIFPLCSDDSHLEHTQGNDEGNPGAVKKIGAAEWTNGHQQQAHKLNVFERNFQYASIYDNKRCALKAKMDAHAKSLCCFKASAMPIAQTPEKRCRVYKFTVPNTPVVLKRKPRT